MNAQLLKRIQLLERKYLTQPLASTKIIIRFVEPSNTTKNSLMKIMAGGSNYERLPNETESDFVERISNLTNEILLIESID